MLKEGKPVQNDSNEIDLNSINQDVLSEIEQVEPYSQFDYDSSLYENANESLDKAKGSLATVKNSLKGFREQIEDVTELSEDEEGNPIRTVRLESNLNELEEIIKVETAHQRLLKKAFNTHAGSTIKNARIDFLYFDDNATQQRSREISLNLISDFDNGNVINLGLKKFPFTKKDIMEVYKNFDDIILLCEGLFEDQIKEYEKQKEEKEKAKEQKGKQLSLVPDSTLAPKVEEEDGAYFSSVKVNKKIFMELEGEFVPMVFETKPLDRNTYVISLNGKDYFTKMDLIMIYSKYDGIMERYLA